MIKPAFDVVVEKHGYSYINITCIDARTMDEINRLVRKYVTYSRNDTPFSATYEFNPCYIWGSIRNLIRREYPQVLFKDNL